MHLDYQTIVTGLLAVHAGASFLANLTKTDRDNRIVGWFGTVVNVLAGNITTSSVVPPTPPQDPPTRP